jgi:hypothetical protein
MFERHNIPHCIHGLLLVFLFLICSTQYNFILFRYIFIRLSLLLILLVQCKIQILYESADY